jgi:transcriptional regulator with XRE-family HTH domain/sRNA-binding regulator protein Hfq
MPEDLWKIRQRKKMTVTQLAEKSGVPARLINEYEAGERPIRSKDLPRLARVLFVDVSDIKITCDPIPPSAPAPEVQAKPAPHPPSVPPTTPGEPPVAAPVAEAAPPRPGKRQKKAPLMPGPARPTQIAQLLKLGERLGLQEQEFEARLAKPLAEATRFEVSKLLVELQSRLAEERQQAEPGKRRRPYLPESVDEFELRYLTQRQEAGDLLAITLFDGRTLRGRIIGFSPYTITIREEEGSEVTMQKLAIAFYRVEKQR